MPVQPGITLPQICRTHTGHGEAIQNNREHIYHIVGIAVILGKKAQGGIVQTQGNEDAEKQIPIKAHLFMGLLLPDFQGQQHHPGAVNTKVESQLLIGRTWELKGEGKTAVLAGTGFIDVRSQCTSPA